MNKDRLYISNLPSLQDFERFYYVDHVQHWINVSGIDIYQIYPDLSPSRFPIQQFAFPDVFSDGKKLTYFSGLEHISAQNYEMASALPDRHAFLAAVKALIKLLENQQITGIFCHRGMSRSPLVAVAALNCRHSETLAQSIQRVQTLHQPAHFSEISISALIWMREQFSTEKTEE